MGNSQSTPNTCSPLCRTLCWSSPSPAKVDDGEWFGDLPRDKKRASRKSNSRKSMTKLPVVPEVQESAGAEDLFDDKLETNGTPTVESVSSRSLISFDSSSLSEGGKKKSKTDRGPKLKLTYVNGQFVDPTKKRGQQLLKAASSEEGAAAVGGITVSIPSGHCGGLAGDGGAMTDSKGKPAGRRKSLLKSKSGNTSSSSVGSAHSLARSLLSSSTRSINNGESDASGADDTNAVTSMVALGDGRFLLTASKSDCVIKMWRLEGVGTSATIEFVRDFVGHKTGVTCLAKVDDKGRFLSASKDNAVKLWDSRFNCDGDDGNESERVLLATFEKMDRRRINSIAVTEKGTYVRPTDSIDMAMVKSVTTKAIKEGSGAVQKAASERQIIACDCEFASITEKHDVVKVWSVQHIDQDEDELNVAEVKFEQDLKHDAVVESIASAIGKGMILTGDRMGTVRLWTTTKNVFLPDNAKVWASVRTFKWRPKAEQLCTFDETKLFGIASLTFLDGNALFVSGSKGGDLRVWKTAGTSESKKGEIVSKEVVCITGAHSQPVKAIVRGPRLNEEDGTLSFSSASEDGKTLSFAVPAAPSGGNSRCFSVINHGIANRYFPDEDKISVTALACLTTSAKKDRLVTGSTDGGSINLLMATNKPKQGEDALLGYRRDMEEEKLVLQNIAEEMMSSESGVECQDRKKRMMTYKETILGEDVVSYLLDNGYAATRKDGIELGRILATHLELFECVSKKGRELEDTRKLYYRWSSSSCSKSSMGTGTTIS